MAPSAESPLPRTSSSSCRYQGDALNWKAASWRATHSDIPSLPWMAKHECNSARIGHLALASQGFFHRAGDGSGQRREGPTTDRPCTHLPSMGAAVSVSRVVVVDELKQQRACRIASPMQPGRQAAWFSRKCQSWSGPIVQDRNSQGSRPSMLLYREMMRGLPADRVLRLTITVFLVD